MEDGYGVFWLAVRLCVVIRAPLAALVGSWSLWRESLLADEHPATISTDYRQWIRLCQHRALVSLSIGTVRFLDGRRTTP